MNTFLLISCRYFYFTVLREPVSRFISEYRHVKRGATWSKSLHLCNGRLPTLKELPPCYETETWTGVSLDEFLSCDSNLARNRQTRMLADLRMVGCYDKKLLPENARDEVMLDSAKHNLKNMAFFALAEEQELSQFLFQQTFKLDFTVTFTQAEYSKSANTVITAQQNFTIQEQNKLDIELYKYGKSLFHERVEKIIELFPLKYEEFVKEVNSEVKTEFPDGGPVMKIIRRAKESE